MKVRRSGGMLGKWKGSGRGRVLDSKDVWFGRFGDGS